MSDADWLHGLFSCIDRKDTAAFAAHLAPAVSFRFGNAPPVSGRAAVAAVIDGFFGAIAALSHRQSQSWRCGDTLICHGEVSYRRHDGSELTVPFANVMRLDGALATDYRIFADVLPLFAPTS